MLIILLGDWRVISIGEVHRSSGALEDERERGTPTSQLCSVYFRQQDSEESGFSFKRLGGRVDTSGLFVSAPATLLLIRIEKM